ncbi:hypothetical protein VNO78_23411 [Psophocarpus tetragonolobus]|uniref:Uncharacterized protein n=1 Tax=Psophocarpus tetragonolobus TaxID=3891 RepID=A0AAN9XDS3_PSOTE
MLLLLPHHRCLNHHCSSSFLLSELPRNSKQGTKKNVTGKMRKGNRVRDLKILGKGKREFSGCMRPNVGVQNTDPIRGHDSQFSNVILNFNSPTAQDTLTPSWKTSLEHLKGSLKEVPWKAFFQNRSVWAMIYGSFCISWGNYNFGAWLPTYFSKELHLNLTEAAWVSILPPLAAIFFTLVAAQLADSLISRGVEITLVRKITQSIAFVAPAICLTLTVLDIAPSPWLVVGILTGGLSLTSFSFSGLYCTHQDISPEYASILVGITNTVGAIPGIVGVALTGFLLDATQSWSISLFLPAIFFYVTGTIVWLIFANNKPQSFSEKN